MISAEIRREKMEDLDILFRSVVTELENGNDRVASSLRHNMVGFSTAFRGLDSDLFWYGVRLQRVLAEFESALYTDQCTGFNAWAMGEACTALRAAA